MYNRKSQRQHRHDVQEEFQRQHGHDVQEEVPETDSTDTMYKRRRWSGEWLAEE